MTEFEMVVWASVYGARYVDWLQTGSSLPEREAASTAFEAATYAIHELRRKKIEPVFGDDCGASSEIEKEVLAQLGGDDDEEVSSGT